ncbi:MAG: hypothetical protein LWY06_19745 [Firmicutes bacterium]|nr:hypothetical protein [Bacillota bacterium]
MNLNKALDKKYEGKTFRELADAPIAALAGVSDNDGKLLEQAFGIKTIKDMANLKYFRWAQAIANLADAEE